MTKGVTKEYKEYVRRYRKQKWKEFKINNTIPDRRCIAQAMLVKTLCKVLGPVEVVEEARFDWLRGKCERPFRVDALFPHLRVVVEYDGEQHFFPVRWKGQSAKEARDQYVEQVRRDKLKDELLTSHGYVVMRFAFFEPTNDEDYVRRKVKMYLAQGEAAFGLQARSSSNRCSA